MLKIFLFADDTNILYSDKDIDKAETSESILIGI